MKWLLKTTGTVTAMALTAQPCFAAGADSGFAFAPGQNAAFAGATIRLPLGGGRQAKPQARLQIAPEYRMRDAISGEIRTFRPNGLELGRSASGKAELFVAGQSTSQVEERVARANSTGTTLLIVGGIVLLVVVAAAVASASPTPGPGDGDFD